VHACAVICGLATRISVGHSDRSECNNAGVFRKLVM